jgi:hypothetical protein
MSSSRRNSVGGLPTFAALDSYAVLNQERRGASIQVDTSYFRGQMTVMDAIDSVNLTKRHEIAIQSYNLYDDIDIDFVSLTEENLQTASTRFRQILQQMPEVQYLKHTFPETCFIVPEWLRTYGRVHYSARIYFFREDSAPTPNEIIQRNIEAVVANKQTDFEQYQGRLHGYPDCCIDHFASYNRQREAAPELAAIEPLTDAITDDAIQESSSPSTSIENLFDGLFEIPAVYAFFAREFYPEPECQQARQQGISIYDVLCDRYPERLIKDFFRINVGWSYQMAQGVTSPIEESSKPSPGTFGREQLLFHLPLSEITTLPRYVDGAEN